MSGDGLSNSETASLARRGYLIGKKIGEGSYAKVFKTMTYDMETKKRQLLACKIYDLGGSRNEPKQLPREVLIHMRLDHINIIHVQCIMTRGPKVFIFMQYAENGDLLNHIKSSGPIPEVTSKKWFQQMSSAVEYIHGMNISHRDLKCENILLSRTHDVKIADFGFARSCIDENGHRILSNTFCGSCAYAAPEIVRGIRYNPKLADIWSLGVILFIMLHATMPFDDSSFQKLLMEQTLDLIVHFTWEEGDISEHRESR